MNSAAKGMSVIILLMGSLTSLWFFVTNMQSMILPLTFFAVLLILVLIASSLGLLLPQKLRFLCDCLSKIAKHRFFPVVTLFLVACVGLVLRFLFYVKFTYVPAADPGHYFTTAQSLASGAGLGENSSYVAFFPYLASYDNLLGCALTIIKDPWLATIILNSVCDLFAALIVFFLVKASTKSTPMVALIAFTLWFLSPFNIIFSVLSLPIITTNSFIITTVFVAFLLTGSIKNRMLPQSLLLSLLLGVVIGCGNCFRPIFIIAIVALALFFFILVLGSTPSKKVVLLVVSSLVIVFAVYFGIQQAHNALVSHQTGETVPSATGGWSIYVGANFDSQGVWNREDDDYLEHLRESNTDNQAVHNQLQSEGLERYRSYGVPKTLELLLEKLAHFSGSQNFLYNANGSIVGYQDSTTAHLVNVYLLFYLFFLFAACARFLFLHARHTAKRLRAEFVSSGDFFIVFITILMLGFFLSDMLVETSNRYAQIMYPLFIVVAALSLQKTQRALAPRKHSE